MTKTKTQALPNHPEVAQPRHTSKVRGVPIHQMRVPPVHITQRPFRKAHGDRLAANLDLELLGLPVINYRDGIYWVVEGQHRVYALRQRGFDGDMLDCQVYNNLSDEEMANRFLGGADTLPCNPYDKFFISITGKHVRECEVQQCVEDLGLKVSKGKSETSLGCVSTLCRIYDRFGLSVLRHVLQALKLAFPGDKNAFESALVDGLALVYGRYSSSVRDDEMSVRLMTIHGGPRGLLRRAENQRERTGGQKPQCVAAVIVEVYNKGVGSKSKVRLPSWWKEISSNA